MAEQRLPKVNQDDGTWGDILRQYLKKEHTDDGTDNAANGGHQHITITASDGTAGTAPIRLTSGTLLSVAAIGAIEFNNDTLYFTKTTGTTRMQVVMDTATQTLTNKTLTSPTISAPTFSGSYSFGGTPTWPTFNQSTTGSAATLTTSRTFQTNLASTSTASFNGSANVTPGVTGTLPVANGGTGRATSTTPYGIIAAGTGATTAQQTIAPGTTGQFLKSAGASALGSFANITQADVANLTTDLAAKAADNTVVKLTGNQTVAGDKTFSDVVTLNDITYAKEINITPTNGAPQSAAFTLDNDNGQVWQFTNNSVGDFAMWDQTAGVGPFYVEGGAPQDAFKVAEDFNYSGQRLEMDGNTIAGSVVDLHPESDGFNVFPHMVNDIAYNTRLGGSTIWKKNGVVTLPDYGDDNIFLPDATMASYLGLSNPTTDTITVEVTLHRAFNWGVKWGIVMTPWCCALNVQLEVWDNVAGSWATAYTKTNDNSGMHWVSYAAPTGHDMTKIRWTLTNFNSPDPRITQIAAIQFNSSLLSGPFATRSGGDIYGTYRFWPDVAGQSASIALDNRVNQSWLHATNSSGQLTMYDETNDKTPFLINRNTPTGALTLDTTEIHAQLPVNMHSQKITGVTDPTSAQDAATKNYVDTTTVSPSGAQVLTNKNLTSATNTFPTFNQNTTGSAATLTTSRTFQTNLASTSAVGFNGSANNVHGVTGTLPVANGGTGATTFTSGYVLTGNATSPVTATKAAPSGAFVGTTDTQTLSSKRITPRTAVAAVGASYTIDSDATDYYTVAGQNQNVTFNNPTGTPVDGQKLMVRIKDDGTPRLVGWGSNFQASGITGPLSQTVPNKEHNVLFVYSTGVSKWVCLASDSVGY